MKTAYQWVLYAHKGYELVISSKPLESKQDAEKAREKFPERERRKIGVGRSL